MNKKNTQKVKIKLQKGDKVQVIAGSDKGKQGKILAVDRQKGRIIVEGVNMLTKHVKPGKSRTHQNGGIVHQEGYIHASNAMYVHNGKPTRISIAVAEKNGKKVKRRVARSTGDSL